MGGAASVRERALLPSDIALKELADPDPSVFYGDNLLSHGLVVDPDNSDIWDTLTPMYSILKAEHPAGKGDTSTHSRANAALAVCHAIAKNHKQDVATLRDRITTLENLITMLADRVSTIDGGVTCW